MKPRRPSYQSPAALEALGGGDDPIERRHAAHETAFALVTAGHRTDDPDLVGRLVTVVDQIGLTTLADLWAGCAPRSLPGALYRLYLLREWLRADPAAAARAWAHGRRSVSDAAPSQVLVLADEILHGAFSGDVAVALDRAAACCLAVAAGRRELAHDDEERRRAGRLAAVGDDLAACAQLWRDDRLE